MTLPASLKTARAALERARIAAGVPR